MALYRLNEGGGITRTADGAVIPADPENRDYLAYLAWAANNTPDPAPAVSLYDVAAAARYDAEISGISLNGTPILTDRQSQALINGAVSLCERDPTRLIRFKTGSNVFVTLDATTVFAIGVAVGGHVQACFAREAEVSAEIAAGTLTTPAAVRARFTDLTGA